jgi:hypothetical protein
MSNIGKAFGKDGISGGRKTDRRGAFIGFVTGGSQLERPDIDLVLGAFFAAPPQKTGLSGAPLRSGPGAVRRGCSAPLLSLARARKPRGAAFAFAVPCPSWLAPGARNKPAG